MSKRKGVSAEAKRTRLLELFHETQDFFQLKELEKIAPKEKGIISQTVKDVLQSLVDDGLVDTDKIGTSVYYWAYPNKAVNIKKRQLQEIEEKCSELNLKLDNVKEALKKAKETREPSAERENLLQKITELKLLKNELETKLAIQANSDPKSLETLKDKIKKTKNAANHWTDNIFAVKSWCKNKFMIEGHVLDKHFEIPADLDYLE